MTAAKKSTAKPAEQHIRSFKYQCDKDLQSVGRYIDDILEYGVHHTDSTSFTITTPSKHQATFF